MGSSHEPAEQRRGNDGARRARIAATLADIRSRLRAAGVTELPADDLYDEAGLPR